MSKDYYSGPNRKTSGARRGTRDRVTSPHEARVPGGIAGVSRDASDELSNLLILGGAIKHNQPQALTAIRKYVSENSGMLHRKLVRAGESALDAGNAIRARLSRPTLPKEFKLAKPVRGRGGFGTMGTGTQVKIRGAESANGKLAWRISGQTANGRHVGQSIPDDEIGGLTG